LNIDKIGSAPTLIISGVKSISRATAESHGLKPQSGLAPMRDKIEGRLPIARHDNRLAFLDPASEFGKAIFHT
jgi:hypothetical protein